MQSRPTAIVWFLFVVIATFASACLKTSSSGVTLASGGRIELSDNFRSGEAKLECQMRCAFAWGLERQHAKGLYNARAWRELALQVLDIGYGDDLSYYYLGKAAEGLGYDRAAEIYYRLSRDATLKCTDIYGDCYGFVFPRDARLAAAAMAKKPLETKRQVAAGPRPKEAARPGPFTAFPASAAAETQASEPLAERGADEIGAGVETSETKIPARPPEMEKRPPQPAAKSQRTQKPSQPADGGKAKIAEAKSAPAPAPVAPPVTKTVEYESKPQPRVTFEEVNEKFGSHSRLTEAQKREEWKKFQGKCVEWSGELSYVGDSFLRGRTLGFKHNPRTLTYDVLVSTSDNARDVAQMKKGGRYTYSGTLRKYGGPILPISVDWGCRGQPHVTEQAKAG